MIVAIIKAFSVMGWGMRIAAIVGPLLLLGTAYGVWHHRIYERGYNQAISDIAAEDAAAVGRAVEKRGVWKNCKERGGTWVQSTGECK